VSRLAFLNSKQLTQGETILQTCPNPDCVSFPPAERRTEVECRNNSLFLEASRSSIALKKRHELRNGFEQQQSKKSPTANCGTYCSLPMQLHDRIQGKNVEKEHFRVGFAEAVLTTKE